MPSCSLGMSLEFAWGLMGHSALCALPADPPGHPKVIQVHSHRSAVLPAELLKFWCLQQGLVSHSAVVWWLEPGHSLGLKLGKEFLGEGGEWVVSGGTQPRTDEQRSCQSLLKADNHWVAWGMEHRMPLERTWEQHPSEKARSVSLLLCLVLPVCKRRGEEGGVGFYALWAVSGWAQTCEYIYVGKALPLAERNLPVPWV